MSALRKEASAIAGSRHATPRPPRHATPRHATPRHTTPSHAKPGQAKPSQASLAHIACAMFTGDLPAVPMPCRCWCSFMQAATVPEHASGRACTSTGGARARTILLHRLDLAGRLIQALAEALELCEHWRLGRVGHRCGSVQVGCTKGGRSAQGRSHPHTCMYVCVHARAHACVRMRG